MTTSTLWVINVLLLHVIVLVTISVVKGQEILHLPPVYNAGKAPSVFLTSKPYFLPDIPIVFHKKPLKNPIQDTNKKKKNTKNQHQTNKPEDIHNFATFTMGHATTEEDNKHFDEEHKIPEEVFHNNDISSSPGDEDQSSYFSFESDFPHKISGHTEEDFKFDFGHKDVIYDKPEIHEIKNHHSIEHFDIPHHDLVVPNSNDHAIKNQHNIGEFDHPHHDIVVTNSNDHELKNHHNIAEFENPHHDIVVTNEDHDVKKPHNEEFNQPHNDIVITHNGHSSDFDHPPSFGGGFDTLSEMGHKFDPSLGDHKDTTGEGIASGFSLLQMEFGDHIKSPQNDFLHSNEEFEPHHNDDFFKTSPHFDHRDHLELSKPHFDHQDHFEHSKQHFDHQGHIDPSQPQLNHHDIFKSTPDDEPPRIIEVFPVFRSNSPQRRIRKREGRVMGLKDFSFGYSLSSPAFFHRRIDVATSRRAFSHYSVRTAQTHHTANFYWDRFIPGI